MAEALGRAPVVGPARASAAVARAVVLKVAGALVVGAAAPEAAMHAVLT